MPIHLIRNFREVMSFVCLGQDHCRFTFGIFGLSKSLLLLQLFNLLLQPFYLFLFLCAASYGTFSVLQTSEWWYKLDQKSLNLLPCLSVFFLIYFIVESSIPVADFMFNVLLFFLREYDRGIIVLIT